MELEKILKHWCNLILNQMFMQYYEIQGPLRALSDHG